MSPRARITTLNLGSQSIELAEFRTQARGGLILCGYRSRELLADPTKVGTRHTQILTALREMLGELRIKGRPVNYTVAAGACTAIVRGSNRTTGVGLVAVYPPRAPIERNRGDFGFMRVSFFGVFLGLRRFLG